jgi:hypothetical protein
MTQPTKVCNKCNKELDSKQFKSLSRKRCITCNVKQYKLNHRDRHIFVVAKECGLFNEANALARKIKHGINPTPMDEGRYLLYRGIAKMIEFDPARADIREDMTSDEKEYWVDLKSDIRRAGEILIPLDSFESRLDWILSFVPQQLHRDIEFRWEGIERVDGTIWLP